MSLRIDDAAVMLLYLHAYLISAVFLIVGLGRAYCYDKLMNNGWKNAGLPWGYNHHPDLMWARQHYSA